jgi:hypothetical protein
LSYSIDVSGRVTFAKDHRSIAEEYGTVTRLTRFSFSVTLMFQSSVLSECILGKCIALGLEGKHVKSAEHGNSTFHISSVELFLLLPLITKWLIQLQNDQITNNDCGANTCMAEKYEMRATNLQERSII